MPAPQSYKTHTRWDPVFHFFAAPVLLLNPIMLFIWHVRHMGVFPRLFMWLILVSIALLLVAMKARMYSLKAQDRAIRSEEKMRLVTLCSPSEMVELDSLSMSQYVALRFASNPELPALARRAIRENLTPKQIKESIVSWRADTDRV